MVKIYEVMRRSGNTSIILGILIICAGVLSIISGSFITASGATLLKNKDDITF